MHSVKAFSGIKSAYIALGITSCFLKKKTAPHFFLKKLLTQKEQINWLFFVLKL
jgi:hypothetical protein